MARVTWILNSIRRKLSWGKFASSFYCVVFTFSFFFFFLIHTLSQLFIVISYSPSMKTFNVNGHMLSVRVCACGKSPTSSFFGECLFNSKEDGTRLPQEDHHHYHHHHHGENKPTCMIQVNYVCICVCVFAITWPRCLIKWTKQHRR